MFSCPQRCETSKINFASPEDGYVEAQEAYDSLYYEDSEDEKDMLDFEFHPSFVSNPERRRRRWDQRWDDLVRAVSFH